MAGQRQLVTTSLKIAQDSSPVSSKPNYKPMLESILVGRTDQLPEKLRSAVEELNKEAKSAGKEAEVKNILKDFEGIENNYLLNLINRMTHELRSGTLKNSEDMRIGQDLMSENPNGADSVFTTIGNTIRLLGEERWSAMTTAEKMTFVKRSMQLSTSQCPKEIQTTLAFEFKRGTFDDIPQVREARLEMETRDAVAQDQVQFSLSQHPSTDAVAVFPTLEPPLPLATSLGSSQIVDVNVIYAEAIDSRPHTHLIPLVQTSGTPTVPIISFDNSRIFSLGTKRGGDHCQFLRPFSNLLFSKADMDLCISIISKRLIFFSALQPDAWQIQNVRLSAIAACDHEMAESRIRILPHVMAPPETTRVLEPRTQTQNAVVVPAAKTRETSYTPRLNLRKKSMTAKQTVATIHRNKKSDERVEARATNISSKKCKKSEVTSLSETKRTHKKKARQLDKNERIKYLAKKKRETVREETAQMKKRANALENVEENAKKRQQETPIPKKQKVGFLQISDKRKKKSQTKAQNRQTISIRVQDKLKVVRGKTVSTRLWIDAEKTSKTKTCKSPKKRPNTGNGAGSEVKRLGKCVPLFISKRKKRGVAHWLLLNDFLFPKRRQRAVPMQAASKSN